MTVFLLISILGCSDSGKTEEGFPIVKVGDKILYSSVVTQLLPEGTSVEDSTSIVQGYIENWIRDNLIIIEAEKNIPPDLNLNKLVEDYRSSLLMYHYENQLIKTKLDTIITTEQKKEFYDESGSQFILSHAIVKAIVISDNNNDKSFSNWSSNAKKMNPDELISEANNKKYSVKNDGSTWMALDDLKHYKSDLNLKLCKKGFSTSFSIKNTNNLLLIIAYYNEKEIPPLDYIEGKIEQVMLNNRKTQLLKSVRENLYKSNIAKRNIKFYQ